MPEIIIRNAEEKDINQCAEMSNIEEFRLPDGAAPDEECLKGSLNQIFLVAEENGIILGYIIGYKRTPEEAYLDLLTTNKQHRGKGVGTKLIQEFRKELKTQGVKSYFLFAPTNNIKTIEFYKKNGLITNKKRYAAFCETIQ